MPAKITGDGGSLVKRLDTISVDYLTGFSSGPIQVSDSTAGPLNRVWRVEALEDGGVWLSRANDTNTAWETPTLLFTYTAEQIIEVDLAFAQNGNIMVCLETRDLSGNATVRLYWNDPFNGLGLYTIGEGRNPRLILDNPLHASLSDVLLFYFSDTQAALVYRIQREQFGTLHLSPLVGSSGKFLEEVARRADARLAVIYSEHNQVEGKYELKELVTTLYPYVAPPQSESFVADHAVDSALIDTVIIAISYSEDFEANHAFTVASLVLPIIKYNMPVEDFEAAHAFTSAVLVTPLIKYNLKLDEFETAHAFTSVSGVTVVIKSNQPTENFEASHVITTAALVTV